jgi:hypothetical protein
MTGTGPPYPISLHTLISSTDSSGGNLSGPEFEKAYLHTVKAEHRLLGDLVYPILEELFEDADAYVDRAELRTEPQDLDDEQLLASARHAREALTALGYA